MRLILSMLLLSVSLHACSTSHKSDAPSQIKHPQKMAPSKFTQKVPTTIYKANEAYYDKVSVQLSDDKTRIVGYPHPNDVFYKGKLALPTKLAQGYLLDNRGISQNTAFLNITFAAYAKLKSVPKLSKLNEMILDRNPITELYRCGDRTRFKNEVEELNQLIEKGLLEKKCTRIK